MPDLAAYAHFAQIRENEPAEAVDGVEQVGAAKSGTEPATDTDDLLVWVTETVAANRSDRIGAHGTQACPFEAGAAAASAARSSQTSMPPTGAGAAEPHPAVEPRRCDRDDASFRFVSLEDYVEPLTDDERLLLQYKAASCPSASPLCVPQRRASSCAGKRGTSSA